MNGMARQSGRVDQCAEALQLTQFTDKNEIGKVLLVGYRLELTFIHAIMNDAEKS